MKPIPLLWRTLIRRPTLADHIRILRLRGWTPSTLQTDSASEQNGDKGLSEQRDSKDFLRLLLITLPKLRSWKLNPWFEDEPTFTLNDHVTNLASANSLGDIILPCYPEHMLKACFPDPIDFTGFLNLPALKSLTMKIVEPPSGLPPLYHNKPSETSIKLALHQSHLTEDTLVQILSRTANLSMFEYHYSCDVHALSARPRQFNGPKITQALDQIKRTLRSLIISVDFYSSVICEIFAVTPANYGMTGTLGPMREFKQLEELTVPLVVLLGWNSDSRMRLSDTLPPNLHTLICRDDLEQLDDFASGADNVLRSFRGYLIGEGVGEGSKVLKLHTEHRSRL